MVAPGEFIPIAEEMGLIVDIGRLVLVAEACMEWARWPNDVRVCRHICRPFSFAATTWAKTIPRGTAGGKTRYPERLEIEITQSAFLDGSEVTRLWL